VPHASCICRPRAKNLARRLAMAPAASRIRDDASAMGHSGPDDQAAAARPPPV